jgi:hypothetical protein
LNASSISFLALSSSPARAAHASAKVAKPIMTSSPEMNLIAVSPGLDAAVAAGIFKFTKGKHDLVAGQMKRRVVWLP